MMYYIQVTDLEGEAYWIEPCAKIAGVLNPFFPNEHERGIWPLKVAQDIEAHWKSRYPWKTKLIPVKRKT